MQIQFQPKLLSIVIIHVEKLKFFFKKKDFFFVNKRMEWNETSFVEASCVASLIEATISRVFCSSGTIDEEKYFAKARASYKSGIRKYFKRIKAVKKKKEKRKKPFERADPEAGEDEEYGGLPVWVGVNSEIKDFEKIEGGEKEFLATFAVRFGVGFSVCVKELEDEPEDEEKGREEALRWDSGVEIGERLTTSAIAFTSIDFWSTTT